MAMTRIWNITDDVNPDVKPQNLMVLGSLVKPGRSVQVDEAKLKTAHKVRKDVNAGLLFIGKAPPLSYSRTKKPARAKLDKGVKQAHAPAKPVVEEAPVEAAAPIVEEVKVEDKAEVELKPVEEAPAEMPAEEAPAEEEKTSKGRKKGKGK